MTTTSTPAQRPVVGLLFALAGLLATLSILFNVIHLALGGTWLDFIVDAAIAVAFLLLALGKGAGNIARLFFAIAAIGWAILAIGAFVSLGVVATIGVVLALVGSLISGILVFVGKHFTRLANIVFLLATIFIALLLLNQLVGFLGGVTLVVVILYAVLLLIAGILIAARR